MPDPRHTCEEVFLLTMYGAQPPTDPEPDHTERTADCPTPTWAQCSDCPNPECPACGDGDDDD